MSTTLHVIGAGDVIQKTWPAIEGLHNEGLVRRALVFDRNPDRLKPLANLPWVQTDVAGSPAEVVDKLQRRGVDGPDSVAYVGTPDGTHVTYAERLAPHVGAVAIEKPLALTGASASRLLRLGDRAIPIEHQLYKLETIEALQRFADQAIPAKEIVKIHFVFHETLPVGTRELSPLVFDTGYHGIAIAVAAFNRQALRVAVRIDTCVTRVYENGPDQPRASTAAWLRGVIKADRHDIAFEAHIAKGVSTSEKRITFSGNGRHEFSLNESGHRPHERALRAIILKQRPLISISESIEVVRACEQAHQRSIDGGRYPFGRNIDWQ
jgi:predicted dehydrogenase